MVNNKYNKVFLISLPRHGTTSIFNALGNLGINTSHLGKIFGEATEQNHDSDRLTRLVEQTKQRNFGYEILESCQGMCDVPTPFVFEDLDGLYPNSLFIHITRPVEEWLHSYERMSVGTDLTEANKADQRYIEALRYFRRYYYGVDRFDASAMEAGYHAHYARVEKYFGITSPNLLVLPLSELTPEKGYDHLCDFLGCEKPKEPFPKSNDHSEKPIQTYELHYSP